MVEYLFCEISRKAEGEGIRPHAHDFWQADLVREGTIAYVVDGVEFLVQPGDVLFTPPGCLHGLTCRTATGRALILKYRAAKDDSMAPLQLAGNPLVAPLAGVLESLVGDPPTPNVARRKQIELLLETLAMEAYPEGKQVRRTLRERINQYIASREGGRVTIEELASHIGYSVSHVSRHFKQEHSESLKAYLDRRRAKVSEGLLRYSELTIAEIAERQEFPDLPAFSRFVTQHLGAAPRAIREGTTDSQRG